MSNANTFYDRVRNGLLESGFTIRSWAMKHGHPVSTVHGAARGTRDGIKARRIRRQLQTFAK